MTNDIAVYGLSETARQQAVDHWEFRRRRIEGLLSPFSAAETCLRLTVESRPPWCESHAVLVLPTGTLAAKGRATPDDPVRAIDEAADRLVIELHGHKAMLRREFLHRRRRRRRADLSNILPALEGRHAVEDRDTFVALLTPALRELSDHARRELVVAQLEGIIKPGELSVWALLTELVSKAWEGFATRPPELPLELWLTGVLHELLDRRGLEPRSGAASVDPGDARLSAQSGSGSSGVAGWPALEPLTLASIAAVPGSGSAWERASDEEQRAWILSQLRGFSRACRRAFTLYVLEGWNDDEIAALQKRTPEDVLFDVERVRNALEVRLAEPRAGGSRGDPDELS